VVALLGTRHSPDYRGSILLLEDVAEPAYRLDRMLTQLGLAGILDAVSAVILGHFVGPRGSNVLPDVERVVMELTATRNVPVISGFPHGHTLPNVTVPIGMIAELETDRSVFRVVGQDWVG
jgi:muramoyltetrapeptide carboxypeptidase